MVEAVLTWIHRMKAREVQRLLGLAIVAAGLVVLATRLVGRLP